MLLFVSHETNPCGHPYNVYLDPVSDLWYSRYAAFESLLAGCMGAKSVFGLVLRAGKILGQFWDLSNFRYRWHATFCILGKICFGLGVQLGVRFGSKSEYFGKDILQKSAQEGFPKNDRKIISGAQIYIYIYM